MTGTQTFELYQKTPALVTKGLPEISGTWLFELYLKTLDEVALGPLWERRHKRRQRKLFLKDIKAALKRSLSGANVAKRVIVEFMARLVARDTTIEQQRSTIEILEEKVKDRDHDMKRLQHNHLGCGRLFDEYRERQEAADLRRLEAHNNLSGSSQTSDEGTRQ